MNSKNTSPVEWYLVSVLLKFEPKASQPESQNGYRHIWENTYLVKANHPLVAFDKGLKFGKSGEEDIVFKDKTGRWCLTGVREVLPIYEKITDGSELMRTDWGKLDPQKTNNKIMSKDEFTAKLTQ